MDLIRHDAWRRALFALSSALVCALPCVLLAVADCAQAMSAAPPLLSRAAAPAISSPSWVLHHWGEHGLVTPLISQAADVEMAPASITKLLTAYVVLKAISQSETTLGSTLQISEQAAAQDGTRVGYRAGETITVQDALRGMLAISGNDAAWAIAQHISQGDVRAFAAKMNAVSAQLGLSRSHWQNPHGLSEDLHVSSAHDLIKLAHALWFDFPQARPWLGVKTYVWNGLTQSNRNSLLWRDATVDGLKTGHTQAAGYNLAASSVWRVVVGSDAYDWRLSSVVLGASTAAVRADDSAALLAWGRAHYTPWRLYAAGEGLGQVQVAGAVGLHGAVAQAPVWHVLPASPLAGTTRPVNALRYELLPLASARAPVAAGQAIGVLHVYDGAQLVAITPAISPFAIRKASWYQSLWAWVKSWF